MEKFTIDYSTKNIPLPSKKLYLKSLTDKVEKVIKRMRWKAFYFDNDAPDDEERKETYGFKTLNCPPQHNDLKNFENDLHGMIKTINFKPSSNHFQDRLKQDINKIKSSEKAFIPADKTRNFYEMTKSSHDKLYYENVTQNYKKSDKTFYNEINMEAKEIAEKLNLSDRIECLAQNNAFITLKDHKDDFISRPKCRLINPAKPELGKVSKVNIESINNIVREKTKVHQWHNSDDVITWFTNIKRKKSCVFVQFDIEEFYPSITKKLVEKAIEHASKYTTISEEQKRIILHSRKSLLFTNGQHWIKSKGDKDFDVTMGSYDGAELCELVGLFILYRLSEKYGIEISGLYRDDGLSCFEINNGHDADKIRKDFIQLFREEFDLKITIDTNLTTVNFLDITLNLLDGTYKPYNKPNSNPVYVHAKSNHPPNIIKRIPTMISERISKISSNKEIFDRASQLYNDALQSSGYTEKLTYKPPSTKRTKSRPRKIIWFNPPFSTNVKTNVAKRFLSIVDKNFPKNHRLHKIFNRNNLKVSYSCLPSVSRIISAHNKKVLNDPIDPNNNNEKLCNCRIKNECPLNGNCLVKEVIYKCNVKKVDNEAGKHYIGLTANSFKQRWYSHKHTFRNEDKKKSTELSNHVWDLQLMDISPQLNWEIIDHARPYINGSKRCNLCLTEKFHIMTSELDLINKRSELVSKCRHVNKYLLKNFKAVPPDKL